MRGNERRGPTFVTRPLSCALNGRHRPQRGSGVNVAAAGVRGAGVRSQFRRIALSAPVYGDRRERTETPAELFADT